MSAAAVTLDQEIWQPKFNPWLIAVIVSLAAFMEVLDTSIANVALPYIAGSLAASNDESTWVLTSYLASNAIVLPISGWLAGTLGRKRFFMGCMFIFTVSSFLCGIAPSLGLLLLFRAVQGIGGGGLQPMAQAILADTFPPEKRGLAFALYGITVVVAPTIGPTLGGWITFNYSWRWIFFINIPVGIVTLLLLYRVLEDPPYLARLRGLKVKFDYIGISLLALGIGALQIFLDRGQEDDWFGSRFITTLVIVSAVSLVSLVIWEWFHEAPAVDVKMFKIFNFATASVMMFFLYIVLFASLVMLPLFLQTLLGYTAQVAGFAISPGASVLLIEMPIMGILTTKVQARRLIAFGWCVLAISMYYSTQRLDLEISFSAAVWLRVVQVLGMGFLFVPISLAAYNGIAPEKNNAVAALVSFMRNIGSSVGTSMVTTLLARRAQYHQQILVGYVRPGNPNFQNALTELTSRLAHSGLGAVEARGQAIARFYQGVLNQATNLSYIDVYMVLAVMSGVMFFLAFALKKNDPRAGAAVHTE
jgi:DHA2 family multidrug resistance protein